MAVLAHVVVTILAHIVTTALHRRRLALGRRRLALGGRWLPLGSRWLTLGCRWLALATTLKIFAGIVTTILARVIAEALPCRRRALSRRRLGLRRDSNECNGRRLALGGRLLTLGCRRLALCFATSLKIFAGIVTTILACVTSKIVGGV